MVFLRGLDSKSYWQRLSPGGPVPELACPDPACESRRLAGHGWYRRYLDGVYVLFRRLRCVVCRVSHALLPEDVCAYQDLRLAALEQVLAAQGPSEAVRSAGEPVDAASVRRARRRQRSPRWARLRQLLPPAETLGQGIEAAVGQAAGQLVRLRHWLWRQWVYLLGGPVGLFRHGRPGGGARRGSP